MRGRTRQHREEEPRQNPRRPPQPDDRRRDDIDALRAEAADLIEAAGEAIGNALSGNSTEFIRAVRQSGGQ